MLLSCTCSVNDFKGSTNLCYTYDCCFLYCIVVFPTPLRTSPKIAKLVFSPDGTLLRTRTTKDNDEKTPKKKTLAVAPNLEQTLHVSPFRDLGKTHVSEPLTVYPTIPLSPQASCVDAGHAFESHGACSIPNFYNHATADQIHVPYWRVKQGTRLTEPSICRNFLLHAFPHVERLHYAYLPRLRMPDELAIGISFMTSSMTEVMRQWDVLQDQFAALESLRVELMRDEEQFHKYCDDMSQNNRMIDTKLKDDLRKSKKWVQAFEKERLRNKQKAY
ncbi:hypothetical protein Hanom_Chr12g01079221 [Helianthus anomalus]